MNQTVGKEGGDSFCRLIVATATRNGWPEGFSYMWTINTVLLSAIFQHKLLLLIKQWDMIMVLCVEGRFWHDQWIRSLNTRLFLWFMVSIDTQTFQEFCFTFWSPQPSDLKYVWGREAKFTFVAALYHHYKWVMLVNGSKNECWVLCGNRYCVECFTWFSAKSTCIHRCCVCWVPLFDNGLIPNFLSWTYPRVLFWRDNSKKWISGTKHPQNSQMTPGIFSEYVF